MKTQPRAASPALSPPARPVWARPWATPATRAAWRLLASYVARWKLAPEGLLTAALFALSFREPTTVANFYRIVGVETLLVAGVAGVLLAREATRLDAPWRRGAAPATVARAVALASGALAGGVSVALVALALLFGRLVAVSAGGVASGALGLWANLWVAMTLVAALTPPLASGAVRRVALALLVVALYADSGEPLARPLAILRAALLPFALCLRMGVTGMFGWSGALALVAQAGALANGAALIAWGVRRLDHGAPPSE